MAKSSLVAALLCAVLPAASGQDQDLSIAINQRPQFLEDVAAGVTRPTQVYVTLSVLFLGDIDEVASSFALDSFVDVAWRDDRFGPGSPQAFGCTKPSAGIILQAESYAPSICVDYCPPDMGYCAGGAAPAPWSPLLEVTNVAPEFAGTALSFSTAYVGQGPPSRLRLNDPNGTWATTSARFSGPILKVYDLANFPYDTQRLEVLFESNAWTIEDVVLVPSFSAVEIKDNIVASGSMLGWDVQDVSLSTGTNFYPQLNVSYHQAKLSITVVRQSTPYSTRYTMVAFFVVIMVLLGSIHAEGAVRIANAVGGFAAILYLQFILASLTPPLNYLSRLDKFLIVSLVITFICAVLGGVHLWREQREKAAAAAAAEAQKLAKKTDALNGDLEGAATPSSTSALNIRDAAAPARPPSSASWRMQASGEARSCMQVCLARRNPFSGGSIADLCCYGFIFVVYCGAAGGVLRG